VGFEQDVLRRRNPPTPPRATVANVTRSDSSGVWVTPLGGDENHPSGPCRGGTRPTLIPSGDGVALARERLPIGTRVLYVVADDGPWILNWEA